MNEMKITIEISDADRVRVDAFLDILASILNRPVSIAPTEPQIRPCDEKAPEKVKTPTEEKKTATEAQEAEKGEIPQDGEGTVEKPIEEPKPEPKPAPDRKTVKSMAVKKIQAGHRDDVKGLIASFGVEKIDMIPDDRLSEFLEKLEKIGG